MGCGNVEAEVETVLPIKTVKFEEKTLNIQINMATIVKHFLGLKVLLGKVIILNYFKTCLVQLVDEFYQVWSIFNAENLLN